MGKTIANSAEIESLSHACPRPFISVGDYCIFNPKNKRKNKSRTKNSESWHKMTAQVDGNEEQHHAQSGDHSPRNHADVWSTRIHANS
jgi:hypothetical protein